MNKPSLHMLGFLATATIATATAAQDDHRLPGLDRKIDPGEHGVISVAFLQSFDLEQSHAKGHPT